MFQLPTRRQFIAGLTLIAIYAVTLMYTQHLHHQNQSLLQQIDNLHTQQQGTVTRQLNDTTYLTTTKAEVEDELSNILTATDLTLLKEADISKSNIRSVQHTVTQSSYTIPSPLSAAHPNVRHHTSVEPDTLPAEASTEAVSTSAPSEVMPLSHITYKYQDRWLTVRIDTSAMTILTRDSLDTYITRIPKHHFLWWRWGTKGYNVNIINHNPHTQILYNRVQIVKE